MFCYFKLFHICFVIVYGHRELDVYKYPSALVLRCFCILFRQTMSCYVDAVLIDIWALEICCENNYFNCFFTFCGLSSVHCFCNTLPFSIIIQMCNISLLKGFPIKCVKKIPLSQGNIFSGNKLRNPLCFNSQKITQFL